MSQAKAQVSKDGQAIPRCRLERRTRCAFCIHLCCRFLVPRCVSARISGAFMADFFWEKQTVAPRVLPCLQSLPC
jgi:hypothetical protein